MCFNLDKRRWLICIEQCYVVGMFDINLGLSIDVEKSCVLCLTNLCCYEDTNEVFWTFFQFCWKFNGKTQFEFDPWNKFNLSLCSIPWSGIVLIIKSEIYLLRMYKPTKILGKCRLCMKIILGGEAFETITQDFASKFEAVTCQKVNNWKFLTNLKLTRFELF